MKISCSRAALAAALKSCAAVADPRSPSPVLGMVKLEFIDGVLRCTATDINVTLVANVEATGEHGAALAPAVGIAKAADLLPGEEVSVEVSNSSVVLSTGRFKQVVPVGVGVADFPASPKLAGDWTTVDGAALAAVLRGGLVAACQEETRWHLCGVMVEASGGTISGRSTDGHRAHVVRRQLGADLPPGIIPSRGCERLIALIGDAESVEIACSDKYRHVRAGGSVLSVKIIEGAFPPFDQIIPAVTGPGVVMDRAEIMAAMRRASLATDAMHGVVFRRRGTELAIEAQRKGDGFAAEEVHSVEVDGAEFAVCANPKYVSDAAKVLQADQVAMHFTGDLAPVAFTDAGGSVTTGDVVVIMPMRS